MRRLPQPPANPALRAREIHDFGPGFVVVLEQLPDNSRFDRESREQLLDVFRDAADFWGERKIPFRCFYSFQ